MYREKVFTLQVSQKGLKGEEAEVANRVIIDCMCVLAHVKIIMTTPLLSAPSALLALHNVKLCTDD